MCINVINNGLLTNISRIQYLPESKYWSEESSRYITVKVLAVFQGEIGKVYPWMLIPLKNIHINLERTLGAS